MKQELELLTADKFTVMVKEQNLKLQNQAVIDVKDYWKKHVNKELHEMIKYGVNIDHHSVSLPAKYTRRPKYREIFIQQLTEYGKELGFNVSWDASYYQIVFKYEDSNI